jgi:hypothetical protein
MTREEAIAKSIEMYPIFMLGNIVDVNEQIRAAYIQGFDDAKQTKGTDISNVIGAFPDFPMEDEIDNAAIQFANENCNSVNGDLTVIEYCLTNLIKDTYTREEVINKLKEYWNETHGEGANNQRLIDWIKENL